LPKIFFHFPDFEAFVSGGNSYNKRFQQILLKYYIVTKVNDIADADIVISDTIFLNDNETLEFLNQPRLKKIIIVHHLKHFEDDTYLEEFTLLKKFDLLIANSQYTAITLQKNGIDVNKIITIEPPANHPPNLLNIRTFNSIKVLMAANWIERKGFIELFNAIKEVGDYPNDLTITIFGDNTLDLTYYEKCVQIINESVILSKIIKIKDALPPEKMLNTFQNYNLYISSSKMETYGMAVKEAINNGLYVLALSKGNLLYLVNEPTQGKLFENMDELVKYLFYISENELDYPKHLEHNKPTGKDFSPKFEFQIHHFVNQLTSF